MPKETKQIAKIKYITDTETGMYKMGDVNGAFNEADLESYIKRYGHKKLCAQLGYMQFQVWTALRKVNAEKDKSSLTSRCIT